MLPNKTLESCAELFDKVEVIVARAAADRSHCNAVPDSEYPSPANQAPTGLFEKGDSSPKKCWMEAARSDIVAFLDDDVIVPPGWIPTVHEAFADLIYM